MDFIQILIDLFLRQADIAVPQSCFLPILIAGGISALASAGTAAAGASANRKNQRILNQMNEENESEYLKEYYRSALDNEGSRAYLKRLDQRMRDNDRAINNGIVSTGATHENALAKKESNNRVMSDAVSGLLEQEEKHKQQAKSNYFQRRDSIRSGKMNQNSAVAQNWADIGQSITSAAGMLASAYMQGGDKLLNSGGPNSPEAYAARASFNFPAIKADASKVYKVNTQPL